MVTLQDLSEEALTSGLHTLLLELEIHALHRTVQRVLCQSKRTSQVP